MLGGVVDVPDAGQLARHPPGVFTLGELRAATRSPNPAIPPDITAVAAEVRGCGGISPAWLPAHPALPAAGAQAHHAGRAHRLRCRRWGVGPQSLTPVGRAPGLQHRSALCHLAAERVEAMWKRSPTATRPAVEKPAGGLCVPACVRQPEGWAGSARALAGRAWR